ncbi:MAG: response regulator transcription factor [Syntrophobacteraceae bacterium]
MGKVSEVVETVSVLIVEDDHEIAAFVSQGLEETGFKVDVACNGPDGLECALLGDYDALILDIMLPGMNGLDLLRHLRENKVDTPVLILSAKRSLDDRVLGLQTGGDDYLVKPFAFAELLARLQSLIRRSQGNREPVRLKVGELVLDLMARRVYRDEEEIELQPREFTLLEYLVRNANRVVTRTQLLQHVWGYNFNPSTNVIEVHICHLREKLEQTGRSKLLKTVRGVGYILTDKDDAQILL